MARSRKSLSTEELFHKNFAALETSVPNLNTRSKTLQGRFDKLTNAAKDPTLRTSIETRLCQDLRYYKTTLESQTLESNGAPVREWVTNFLFTMLATASIGSPVSHASWQHWIPVCYTRNFSEKVSAKRICYLTALSLKDSVIVEEATNDRTLVHRPGNNSGKRYYQGIVEKFLSEVETIYALTVREITVEGASIKLIHYVVLYMFFIILELRKPNSDGTFGFRQLWELAEELCEALDDFESPCLAITAPEDPIGFTPYERVRALQSKDGVRVKVFPVTPQVVLVLSDSKIDEDEASRLANRARERMLENVSRGQVVYGASLEKVVS